MTNKRIEDTNEDIDLMKMVEEYEKEEAAEQMAHLINAQKQEMI